VTVAWSPRLARRLGFAALGQVAPEVAARRAVRLFTRTRARDTGDADLLPLGARRLDVSGAPSIRGGYLWGEEGAPAALVAPLRALGYRVAAFDAPGHGVCAGRHTTLPEFTAATEAVLDAVGDVRVVVAHSLGSIVAVAAVSRRLGLAIESLVLLAPARTLSGILDRWAWSELGLKRPIVERMRRELSRCDGLPTSYWDIVGLSGKFGCPMLVVYDPEDVVVPRSDAESIAAGLPGTHLEPMPGYGHLAMLMAPRVRDLVAAFVANHASSANGALR
jgi:pimeloyl-ACP methyl ester carboxylesterase